MDADERILFLVFYRSLTWLEQLKAAPSPMPYGLAQRWASFLIAPEAIDKLYEEECPYAWGYAAVMAEMRWVYEDKPKLAFVPKKGAP